MNSLQGVAGDSTSCGNLFLYMNGSGVVAGSDTVTAALHLAWNPILNITSVFGLSSATAPFQPSLAVVPQDFGVSLAVSSGLSQSSAHLLFSATTVGTTSGGQQFTLTNNSQSPIVISGISLSGLNATNFLLAHDCPSSLGVAASCTVQATFTSSSLGLRIAQITIANDSANPTLLATVSGVGLAVLQPTPQLVSVSTSTFVTGSPTSTVVLSGSSFTTASVIYLNGVTVPTTYLSAQSLSFQMVSAYLTGPGTFQLQVRNGNFISGILQIQLLNPVPTLTSVSPAVVIAGAPNFTLTVTGSSVTSSSTLLINGASHSFFITDGTTGTVSVKAAEVANIGSVDVVLVSPTPGGGNSPPLQLQAISADNRVRTLNYATNDLASDTGRHLIYASVTAASANSPNSIVAIDPVLGTTVATQVMSSEPKQLAIADDGSYLHVGLPATREISRLILPSLTQDIKWSPGTGTYGPYSAVDIKVAPCQPHTAAVTGPKPQYEFTYSNALAIYDDGVARKLIPPGSYEGTSYDALAWGSDASTLFVVRSCCSSVGIEYAFNITADGPVLTNTLTSNQT